MMLNKVFAIATIAAVLCFLSGCAADPDGYLKRSANNKLFDRKGFKGGKRAPIYNKKYIAKAKQNVAASNMDDDSDELAEEAENIGYANQELYRNMLEREMESKYLRKKNSFEKETVYPSLVRNSARIDAAADTDNAELRAELAQIKVMLNETKNEMASYKCPTAKELEKAQGQLQRNDQSVSQQNSSRSKAYQEKTDKAGNDSSIVEPIKSI